MYAVRHAVDVVAFPWTTALVLLVAGLSFGLFGHRLMKRGLLAAAALVGYLGSTSLVGTVLLAPLENAYPALREDQALPRVSYVVVLGSGYDPRDHVPVTAALDHDGLARIVEGVRLVRRLGPVRLLVSGGAPAGHVPPAIGYAALATDLGIPPTSLMVSDSPLDTSAEARAVVHLVGSAPFILITSAYHMPRAMRAMQLVGAHPIPAPTGQRAESGLMPSWNRLIPSPGGVEGTQRALHEYLGLAAAAAGLD
jgi:uncharacterized SAM-binding protein YcdF (DUF218 family)